MFHLPVCSFDDLLRLFLCLVDDLLLELLYLLQFLLVFVSDVLERLVCMLDAFEFFIQSLAVACNLAEISLDSNELLAGTCFCILDDRFRQSHLTGQFECE